MGARQQLKVAKRSYNFAQKVLFKKYENFKI